MKFALVFLIGILCFTSLSNAEPSAFCVSGEHFSGNSIINSPELNKIIDHLSSSMPDSRNFDVYFTGISENLKEVSNEVSFKRALSFYEKLNEKIPNNNNIYIAAKASPQKAFSQRPMKNSFLLKIQIIKKFISSDAIPEHATP